ncbi:MAG: metalloregulator ArsR/SmtB family transcription factor [Acidimicrobiales bacterium]
MDEVFKAMADPTRRALLDELFRQDGQTLSELEARFEMTRFGVMKHLKVLEEAGLVVTRKEGREKRHLLNPVPIRLVHDRWVSKYAEPWAAGLSDLKRELEQTMEKIFEIYIKTTPEKLWAAIVDPEARRVYNFGDRVRPGGPSVYNLRRRRRRAPGSRARASRWARPPPAWRSARARCSRSTRRASSSTP